MNVVIARTYILVSLLLLRCDNPKIFEVG